MSLQTNQSDKTRRYLLGQLSDNERATLEERLLVDPSFYEELAIAEDELVDDYLTNDLSSEDREQFERYFLQAPDRPQKLRFNQALRAYAVPGTAAADQRVEGPVAQREINRPFFSWFPRSTPAFGFALAAVIVLAIGIFLFVTRNSSQQTAGQTLAVTLAPGLTRDESASSKKIVMPVGTSTLRLQLQLLANEYQSYEATVTDANGSLVVRKGSLSVRSQGGSWIVTLDLSSASLSSNDYVVKLAGITNQGAPEPVASYSLRLMVR
jgi:hypothetical protein